MHTKMSALSTCWFSDSYCKHTRGQQEGITESSEVMLSGHSNSIQHAEYQTPSSGSHQSFQTFQQAHISLVQ